ncbi:MAG: zinc/iron-chelating domain-containing protein [Betaproteobacteria bacterium CG2_30_59_46]|nr:MAG: zinc/iron-chelating domain-containing protein [Betaproteobacteria bacterium CG2_30_59_46]PIQ12466.1 MAG: zinc/iron-chelating domain-containing protein [Hydrogenophilales bacterium CG18_big_fil_WC_8_21_14_2_50_58_12]PIY00783.1 MAG: zinc/iron-chelating domain-containing protein [Hydrogenophilales bacterium CG_4_10_14_3_um_filter_58_23]PJB08889.1 MAG: zinc/iron-chelating domain-containing protein [Hydrogenophilales bacterium CG_4_9_14_3_um_filter_59_35]
MFVENHTGDAGDSPVISCASCKACCCRLEVMLMGDDNIPLELTERDRWGGWVMARLDDGWCAALDRSTWLCTIYGRRPMICHDYEVGDNDCIEERRLHTNARMESHGASR